MKKTKVLKLVVLQLCICVNVLWGACLVSAGDNLSGVVAETMNSGGYTYALLEKDGEKNWVAMPEVLLSVGDQVELSPGMSMGQYTSKTLGRTFENIFFSGGIVAIEKFKGNKGGTESRDQVEKITIAKATGPDAFTIEELYANKADLVGKRVVVKGKVYKVSKFMGATWIRMKDGTGSRKKGNHKLVITSQETAEVGDVVTIAGVMVVDKKIAGLSYEVLVEKATVSNDE